MTRFLVLAGLAAWCLAAPAVPSARADSRAERREALAAALAGVDRLLADGRPDAALERLAVLEREHGGDALFGWQLRDRRGVALLRSGRAEEALPLLEESVGRRPQDPVAHRNLADALRRLGRRGRALAEYTQAVELAPQDPQLRLEHAQSLASFRMWARAAHEFRQAGELGAGPAADAGLAVSLREQGRPQEAVAPLRRLYAAEPGPRWRRELAATLQAAGRDSALVALLRAVPVDSLGAGELRALVQAEGRTEIDPRATRACVQALAAGHPPPEVAADAGFWGQAALNLVAVADWQDALVAVDRAVALAPDDPVHRTNRVVILQGLGRREEARRAWEELERRRGAGEDP